MRRCWRVALVAALLAAIGLNGVGSMAVGAVRARLPGSVRNAAPRQAGGLAPAAPLAARGHLGFLRQQRAARAGVVHPAWISAAQPARGSRRLAVLPVRSLSLGPVALVSLARPSALFARRAARHAAMAPADSTCPTGFVDPNETGQFAQFRVYLNRSYDGTGTAPNCHYIVAARSLSGVTLNGAYTMEGDITAGDGFVLPSGSSISSIVTGNNLSVTSGTASISGDLFLCNDGIVVSGTLDVRTATINSYCDGEPGTLYWGAILFLPGSDGSVVADSFLVNPGGAVPNHPYPSPGGAIIVDGASPLISNTTITNSGGNGVFVLNGGHPTLSKVTINGCGPVPAEAVMYTFVPADLTQDSGLTATGCTHNTSTGAVQIPGGNYTTSVNWSDPGLPFFINGGSSSGNPDIHVTKGTTMHVAGGTLLFANQSLYVDAADTQHPGGTLHMEHVTVSDTTNNINWGGIAYLPGSAGTLDGVTVQGAGAFFLSDGMNTNNYIAGILISAATPIITNSTIKSNNGNGIEVANGGAPQLINDTSTNNTQWAVQYDGATTALGNDSGLQASGNSGNNPALIDNGDAVRVFLPTSGGASYSPTSGQPLTIPDVGLPLVYDGGPLTIATGTVTFDSKVVDFIGSDLTVSAGASLVFGNPLTGPAQHLRFKATAVAVAGSLTATRGATFESARTLITRAKGDWRGILFGAGSTGTIGTPLPNTAIVDAGGAYLSASGCGNHQAAILVCGSAPTVTATSISFSQGDGIDVGTGGAPILTGVSVDHSLYAVKYDQAPADLSMVSGLSTPGNTNTYNAVGVGGGTVTGTWPATVGLPIGILAPIELAAGSDVTLPDGSYVRGNITVDAGNGTMAPAKLHLNAGSSTAQMQFAGSAIDVGGHLDATNITLTSSQSTPRPGDWLGIAFLPGSDGTLTNVSVQFAGAGYLSASTCGNHTAAILICGSSPVLIGTQIVNCADDGVDIVAGGSPAIASNPTIQIASFTNDSASFPNPNGYAVSYGFMPKDLSELSGLSASGYGHNVVGLPGSTTLTASGVNLLNVGIPYEVAGTFEMASGSGMTALPAVQLQLDGSFTVDAGATLNALSGSTFQFNGTGVDLHINGNFSFTGQPGPTGMVTLLPVPSTGGWGGIGLGSGSTGTFSHVHITGAGGSKQVFGGCADTATMVICDPINPTIQYVVIDGSLGNDVVTGQGAQPVLRDDSFGPVPAGDFAVKNDDVQVMSPSPRLRLPRAAALIAATADWWGSASGPFDPVGNPHGTGVPVGPGVDYGHWLVAPPGTPATLTAPTTPITAGTTVAISGGGFAITETVQLYLDTVGGTPLAVTTAGTDGSLATPVPVPPALAGGHTLIAVGQTSGISATAALAIVPLTQLSIASSGGWSLLSLPLAPTGVVNASAVLAGVLHSGGGTLAAIFALTNGRWSPALIQPSTGAAIGHDFALQPGVGYLVYSDRGGSYLEQGAVPASPPSWTLTMGWNLVGVAVGATGPLSASTVLAGVLRQSGGHLAALFALTNGRWTPSLIQPSAGAAIGHDFTLQPGQGYLLYTDTGTTYTVGSAARALPGVVRRPASGSVGGMPALPPLPSTMWTPVRR